jgi:hypothetical protein
MIIKLNEKPTAEDFKAQVERPDRETSISFLEYGELGEKSLRLAYEILGICAVHGGYKFEGIMQTQCEIFKKDHGWGLSICWEGGDKSRYSFPDAGSILVFLCRLV